jgi:alkanesulfonate monooxygenase SsuD/methylene tetrahydromethanopterin reductase-like flavin-dependent oxidoreductase (luciferase family)
MISKFSVLYVGQIELDRIGRDGTPSDERRYSNERLAEAFQTAKEIAQQMDELGYYCLWTAEHHFQREGYEVFPNLILLSTWLASQTRRLKFGCAFNILPMWHPVRLAEDYAVADIVTGGRIIMGVGRGYHTREVESFGAPLLDAAANRELFEEQMEVLLKCFNEESWSHRGKHYVIPPDVDYRGYRLREITVVPRPLRRPVDIWMPIASGKSIDYMAQ